MHYPEMEKVARKLQSVGEAGYASPRCRLQPDSGRAAPTGTEKGRKASRQKTEATFFLSLTISVSRSLRFPSMHNSPTDMSTKALNFLPSSLLLPGFFVTHVCLEILSLIFDTSE